MLGALYLFLMLVGGNSFKVSYSRDDQVAEIQPQAKTEFGVWAERGEYCNPGSYAYGFKMNVGHKGSKDDTGVNGVVLFCRPTKSGDNDKIASEYKLWGEWGDLHECPVESYITGVSMKSQASQGKFKDDTAANNFQFKCQDGTKLKGAGGKHGQWGKQKDCPANSAICGIKTRMEGFQKYGDNTSLNEAIFYCCKI